MAAHARKESLIMAHTKSTAALLVLGLSAAACAPAGEGLSPAYNPTVYSVNQPVVQRTDYVIDLARAGRGIADAERFRLSQWFESLQLGYGDRVSVDTGRYDDPAVREDVAAVAAEYGLLLAEGTPVTAGSARPDLVRVVVSRSVAFVPECPNWEDAADIGARISTSTNYGCAVNSNIAAMVADPNDLVLGQVGSNRGDMIAGSKAIKSYRDAAPTGAGGALKEASSKGGN
jgi:pilus assembly protein CpaD